jgi:hypothetical protein
MTMKKAATTICAALAMISVGWAQSTPPNKYRTNSPRPHHPLKDSGQGHPHSSAANVVPPRTQIARQNEVARLEHQNTAHLQAQSKQQGSKKNVQPTKVHTEPAGRSSGINFSYRPPHTQPATASGGHKH